MPSMVQMIEADLEGLLLEEQERGMGDLGAGEPSPLLASAFRAMAGAPDIQAYLRALGGYLAKRSISIVRGLLFTGEAPTPPNPWIEGLVMPWIEPVIQGAAQVFRAKARPWVLGAAALTGIAGLGLGALIGRARGR